MNPHPPADSVGLHTDAEARRKAEESSSLYKKQEKIQTLWVRGRFQRLPDLALTFLLLVFFALPWLQWDGRPAFWLNLPERKFIILSFTFWPQDLILLSWLLMIATFGLFFLTVWGGRLWCGYACPQTVWTRGYIWLEYLIEGNRNQRIRLDRSRWNRAKVMRRGLKHLASIALSFLIALTAVGYFTPIRGLISDLSSLELGFVQTFWLLLVTAFSYVFGTSFREQVCIYMCPYARFQSAMFDRDTLIVSYDERRGEPRGKRQRKVPAQEQGKGDCIDCRWCVHACPTGIDIRDGLQYECISCAACIDACDSIMERMERPSGLIGYFTENELAGMKRKGIRPRLVGYGLVLAAIVGLFSHQLATRVPIELDIIRDRTHLYRETYDGGVENVYTLKIINMDQRDHRLRIDANGPFSLRYGGDETVLIEAGTLASLPVRLVVGPEEARSTVEQTATVRFTVSSENDSGFSISEESRFVFPLR
jgi:cytochrome c oxidase accessory protein FixG